MDLESLSRQEISDPPHGCRQRLTRHDDWPPQHLPGVVQLRYSAVRLVIRRRDGNRYRDESPKDASPECCDKVARPLQLKQYRIADLKTQSAQSSQHPFGYVEECRIRLK